MIAPQLMQTAGFLRRVAAYLIDGLLLSLFGGAFPYVIAGSDHSTNAGATGTTLLAFIYFVILWSRIGHGRTLGMWLLGMKVVGTDGQEIGLLTAIGRYIGLVISFLVCFVGVIWVAFDSQHRGWHDKLAGTYVIRV